MKAMKSQHYRTAGGVDIYRASINVDGPAAVQELREELDSYHGVLLSSSFEFTGRYSRWELGFSRPPVMIIAQGYGLQFNALNERGQVLLQMLQPLLEQHGDLERVALIAGRLSCSVKRPEAVVREEERTRQRSVFTVLRALLGYFYSTQDQFLGLYGAFGYELGFQLEALALQIARQESQRDLVLYLPDRILAVDHKKETAQLHYYDFAIAERALATRDLPRTGTAKPFKLAQHMHKPQCDHLPGQYAELVKKALGAFHAGDLFEVVPGQTFSQSCADSPATIFARLQKANPAPYGALMNLGQQEYLVAASPEMFVRVENGVVDTCPISGTIARGNNAVEDAQQIRTLLNSEKDEAELSMCTDVDRNDKARVCIPGSVRLLGRRQVELYSRLIHTVDHVRGIIKPGFDALDAFLSHAWAVTVTGAPKHAAMQFIENNELSPRHWYGGAIGYLGFNGNLNTGLTIRTIRIVDGIAQVRAGATLLADSEPAAEEAETRLKASALLAALQPEHSPEIPQLAERLTQCGAGLKVLMVDHQDSFVHMLSSYLQACGAEVITVRPALVERMLEESTPDLVVLSPGPGRPENFALQQTLQLVLAKQIPVFGVCLGLQGIVEYFGGTLRTLGFPVHGKASRLQQTSGFLFESLPTATTVGRYHSLVADRVPECLTVCARSEDGEVMALMHKALPVYAVQFHPESMLSLDNSAGQVLLGNLLRQVAQPGVKAFKAQGCVTG